MSATAWNRLVKASSLRDGVPKVVETEDADVLVVKLGKKLCACGSMCTHFGGPLAEGLIVGTTVTCPWHNAKFDLCTGRNLLPPALDDTMGWRTRIARGQVEIADRPDARPPKPRGRKSDVFVILGAGASGTVAAMTLRREGFAGRIVLVTAERGVPYDRTALSKAFLQGEMSPGDLALRDRSFFRDGKIELLENARVVGLDIRRQRVRFAKGGGVRYDRLLLATGGRPRPLDIPGGQHAFLLRSLADAKRALKALDRASRSRSGQARRAVLIGGGFIAMEAAASLAERALGVHVISKDAVPLARVFGGRLGEWFRERHEEGGVTLHLGASAESIGRRGKGFEVALDDGKTLKADVVLAAIGIAPVVDYLDGTGLVEKGAVPVNARLETKIPGIFASGDIASVRGNRVEHWVHAERMGQHAARAMLGSRKRFDEPPFFWTRQFERSVQYVGFAPRWDREVVRGTFGKESFLVGYFADGALVAAAGLNRAKEIAAIREALKIGARITRRTFASANLTR